MTLQQIINSTKEYKTQIKSQHKVFAEFQRNNPWFLLEEIEMLKKEGISDIPTFEDSISFKKEFLLTGLEKVYHQIKKRNPLLIDRGEPEMIYFYSVVPGLYKQQQTLGFSKGDRDDNGILVTGSDLIIEIASVNIHEFLTTYYTLNN